jgi:hypothetical protein
MGRVIERANPAGLHETSGYHHVTVTDRPRIPAALPAAIS